MRNTQKTNVLTSLCWIYFTNYEIITSFSVISRQWGGMRSSLQWRHNVRDSVWNHQPHDCLLNRLFRRRLKKTSRLRVTGLCAGNSPGTGEFPAQMASNAENVSIWWRLHVKSVLVEDRDLCTLYTVKPPIQAAPNPKTETFLASSCSCLCPIHWSKVFLVENEDVFGAARTGYALTTSEWSTILLSTKMRLILDVYGSQRCWYHDDKMDRASTAMVLTYLSRNISVLAQKLSMMCTCIPRNLTFDALNLLEERQSVIFFYHFSTVERRK